MLVQSGGGKVYAILADTPDFEIGLMPTLQMISTTVVMVIRCRFKARTLDYFDPMLVPKQVLVGGIERSQNTLRGTVIMNTGFTVDKIGKGFFEIVATRLYEDAAGFILPVVADGFASEECALYAHHRRDDFIKDFGQLLEQAVAPYYPAKDYNHITGILNPMEFNMKLEAANEAKSGFEAIEGGKQDTGPEVTKIDPTKQGVDSDADVDPIMDPKIKLFGAVKKPPQTTPEETADT